MTNESELMRDLKRAFETGELLGCFYGVLGDSRSVDMASDGTWTLQGKFTCDELAMMAYVSKKWVQKGKYLGAGASLSRK